MKTSPGTGLDCGPLLDWRLDGRLTALVFRRYVVRYELIDCCQRTIVQALSRYKAGSL